MSFGDLASSGRGPGIIGLMMAVLVLAGFGAMYIFVFDAEMQGKEVSIESIVRRQAEEIDSYKHQIATNEAVVAETSKIEAKNASVDAKLKKNEADAARIKELKGKLGGMRDSIVATTKAFNSYVAEYKNHVRSQAVGEKIDELTLKSGDTYKNAEIREVSEIGIQIRHADGQKRISYEDLSTEWQERFQYDPEEKAKALAREQAAQKLYEQGVDREIEITEEALGDPNTPEGAELLRTAIRSKELEIASLRTELGRLEGVAVEAEAKDAANRPKGRSDLQLTRDVRGRIQAMESKIAAAVRQLAALKTKQR